MQEVSEESRQVEHARKNVGQLLLRYNDFVRPPLSPIAIQHSCPSRIQIWQKLTLTVLFFLNKKKMSTVSELFIDLHHQMEGLEEGVLRVERKRRKELASRY